MKIKYLFFVAIVAWMAASVPSKGQDVAPDGEFRAAWLATVKGIDWPRHEKDADGNEIIDPKADQEALVKMITDIKNVGCNVLLFQVVSNMDALYPSEILPWCHIVTGTQGQDPGYDPLAIAVKTCRELGLEIHAWINPLRCGPSDMERDSSHVVLAHPNYVQIYKDAYYLDPANPSAREYLTSIICELLEKYDLDGIHIDDYFYPAGFQDDQDTWDDSDQYQAYVDDDGELDCEQWRFENINTCVRELYQTTHEYGEKRFGISPAGRLVNTLRLYADPRAWAEESTIDYLIPQIYWQHGHPIADFAQVLANWNEIIPFYIPIYVGIGAYRYGQKGFESLDEFRQQIDDCREAPNVYGHAWFSAKCILTDEFSKFLKEGPYKVEASQ